MNIPLNSFNQLTELWVDIGYPKEQQEQLTKQICDQLNQLVQTQITKYTEIKQQFFQKNSSLKEKIEKIESIIGISTGLDDLNKKSLVDIELYLSDYLEKLEKKRTERSNEKQQVINEISKLCEELGIVDLQQTLLADNPEEKNSLSEDTIQALRSQVDKLQLLKKERQIQVNNIIEEIKKLWEELDTTKEKSWYEVPCVFDPAINDSLQKFDEKIWNNNLEGFPLTQQTLLSLQQRRESLRTEINNRLTKIEGLQIEIHKLYQRLCISEKDRVKIKPLPTLETIIKLEQEKSQLMQVMDQKMKGFIEENKQVLLKLWGQLNIVQKPFELSDLPNDEKTLEKLELEIRKCEQCIEEYNTISKLALKRDEVLSDIKQMEEWEKDPTRLLSKKRSESARLLKEEKIRNQMKKLPKFTTELKNKIIQFETKYDLPFYVNDVRYLEKIEMYEKEQLEKQEEKNRLSYMKKQLQQQQILQTPIKASQTPRSKTPGVVKGASAKPSTQYRTKTPVSSRPASARQRRIDSENTGKVFTPRPKTPRARKPLTEKN